MTRSSSPARANSAELLALLASDSPGITFQVNPPLSTNRDLKRLGLSDALARKTALEAGGRRIGQLVIVATEDLRAYLRTRDELAASPPPAPKPPKARVVKTGGTVPTATEMLRANGLIVPGEGK